MALKYITKAEAEKKSGLRLDGRKRYFILDNEVFVAEKYTSGCTGCLPDHEYSTASIGVGCHECGYTGKRRGSYPVPVKYSIRKKRV